MDVSFLGMNHESVFNFRVLGYSVVLSDFCEAEDGAYGVSVVPHFSDLGDGAMLF